MASVDPPWPPELQAFEAEYFNWKCAICHLIAWSPAHLQEQWIPKENSIYFDKDSTPWVKCDNCLKPYHLSCITTDPHSKITLNRFVCCQI